MPKGYLTYVLLLFGAWMVLGIIVWLLNKNKPKGIVAGLLFGPAYFVLKHQGWKLTRRELILWGLVFLFMVFAPLISYWLEK